MVYHFDVHTLEYNLIDIYLMLFDMLYSCTTPVARISGTPIIGADHVTLLISSDIDWNQIWYRVTHIIYPLGIIISGLYDLCGVLYVLLYAYKQLWECLD